MIGCLWTCVRKQPIIALYFETETVLTFYNLEAWCNASNFLDLQNRSDFLHEQLYSHFFTVAIFTEHLDLHIYLLSSFCCNYCEKDTRLVIRLVITRNGRDQPA